MIDFISELKTGFFRGLPDLGVLFRTAYSTANMMPWASPVKILEFVFSVQVEKLGP